MTDSTPTPPVEQLLPSQIFAVAENTKPGWALGLSDETNDVIGNLLCDIYRTGEWEDRHEDLLDEWRAARGEIAKGVWRWWASEVGDDAYRIEESTRDGVIAAARREYGDKFRIIESRGWSDLVKDGEEVAPFAETRNAEVIQIGANDSAATFSASLAAHSVEAGEEARQLTNPERGILHGALVDSLTNKRVLASGAAPVQGEAGPVSDGATHPSSMTQEESEAAVAKYVTPVAALATDASAAVEKES